MANIRVAVFVAKAVPINLGSAAGQGSWSPTSCTLLYGEREALLVDTPTTTAQSEDLAAWIKQIAPGRSLATAYITHGHPDHWLGVSVLVRHFPEMRAFATAGTIAHMHESVEEPSFSQKWGMWFGSQIPQPFVFAELMPASNKLLIDGNVECEAIEVGHTDTHDTTILWVPSLKLVVAGDVIYGQVHQMFAIANTEALRSQWLKAIDAIEALEPHLVIAGHQQQEEVHGTWNIAATRQYIIDFETAVRQVKTSAGGPEDLVKMVLTKYADRVNPMVVHWSARAQFA